MTYRDILKKVDHTLLKQPSTWEQIKEICDDAVKYGTASVCIPPSYVKQAAEYLDGKMPVCTVIGFPPKASALPTALHPDILLECSTLLLSQLFYYNI